MIDTALRFQPVPVAADRATYGDGLRRSLPTETDCFTVTDMRSTPYEIRSPRPGDLGWVVQQHGILYSDEFGWSDWFEGLTAEVVGQFARDQDPTRERCWIAEKDGVNVGSVFCMRASDDVARLRMLLVDPQARGLGIGRRLVEECIQFARQAGYRRMTLWTYDVLAGARRIYSDLGFILVHTEPHTDFGAALEQETWELDL